MTRVPTVEEQVIVTLWETPELLSEIPHLEPVHFPTYEKVFSYIKECFLRKQKPMVALLPLSLREQVAELLDTVPPVGVEELRACAERLTHDFLRSELQRLGKWLSQGGDGVSTPTLITLTYQRLDRLMRVSGVELATWETLQKQYLSWLREREHDPEIAGIIGIPEIETLIGGLRVGSLVTVLAPTGGGKTSFGVQIAALSTLKGYPTLFLSLEMTETQIMSRLYGFLTGASSYLFWTGDLSTLTDEQRQRWEQIQHIPLPFYLSTAWTVDEVLKAVIVAKQRYGARLIILDYLQKVDVGRSQERRELEVATVARHLKQIALKHKVCIVAMSQINNEKEARTRESRVIEHESDVLLLLRENPHNPSEMVLQLRKNRMGQTDQVTVMWDAATCRFGDPFTIEGIIVERLNKK